MKEREPKGRRVRGTDRTKRGQGLKQTTIPKTFKDLVKRKEV